MEALQTWAFSVCAAMVACGIAQIVLPKGSMEKVFRITVSIFFLCCLLSPILLRGPALEIEVQAYAQEEIVQRAEKLQQEAILQTQQMAQKEIRQIIEEKLADMGINARDITINISSGGQQETEMLEIELLLNKADEMAHHKIVQELEKTLGVVVHVRYTGGEG